MDKPKQPPRLDLVALYERATETERAALLGLTPSQLVVIRGSRCMPARELLAASATN